MKNNKEIKKLKERIDILFPPVFVREINNKEAILVRGRQEMTHIRQLTREEEDILITVLNLINTN